MGKRGPRPLPSAVKQKRGTPVRGSGALEPRPDRARPSAPKSLSAKAKKIWPKLVAILDDMGVMTVADARVVERYVETWALWRDAVDFLNAKGQVYPERKWNPAAGPIGDDGKPTGDIEVTGFREFPQARQAVRYANILLGIERELGLTPSARTRIEVEQRGPRPVGRPPGSVQDQEIMRAPRLKPIRGGAG